jgi:hypothetical protein
MTLDASGNLGIGTSSPPLKLSLLSNVSTNNVSTPVVMLGSDRVDYYASINSVRGSASTYLGLAFSTSNNALPAEAMRLDPAGNLGLGVTPSASTLPTIQTSWGIFSGNEQINIAQNAYYDSAWRYTTTAAASLYFQDNGAHNWRIAPSGTAGNAISFTQAMTLDASGRLQLGTTTAGGDLTVFDSTSTTTVGRFVQEGSGAATNGALQVVTAATGGSALDVGQWNSSGGSNWIQRWYSNASRATSANVSDAATFRAGINADGNFGLGTSSPAAKLDVASASNGTTIRIQCADGGATVGDVQNAIQFYNNDASVGTQRLTASIKTLNTDATFGRFGRLAFFTASGETTEAERMTLDSSGNLLVGTTTNTNSSRLVVNGTISETVGGVQYQVVSQADIGTAPNEIPLNQYLGEMAYMNAEAVVIQPQASVTPNGIGDMVFQLTNDTTLVVKVKGSDGTVRSVTLTLA